MPNGRPAVLLPWLLSFVLCGAITASAQTAESSGKRLIELLTRMQANQHTNQKFIQQYTSDELWHNQNFDKNSKMTQDESAKFENVFVEGLPYRRKVEANGKPLAGKEAAAEEKRYAQTVEERRKMSPNEKRRGMHITFHSSLPFCCLLTQFDNRIVRHEAIDGRDTVVVESFPKADARPANAEERSALNWKQTSWIDVQDAMPVRYDIEKLNDDGHMSKGTTMRFDYVRLTDVAAGKEQTESVVWLQRNYICHFRSKILWVNVSGTTEQTWSNFKKFRVDMRLLEDSVEEVPDHGTGLAQSPSPR